MKPAKSYPDNNPKTAFGMKKTPMDLVPTALMRHVAKAFENGAGKYGPYNWRTAKISSSVYYAAALRHIMDWWEGEDLAPDSGVHHLGHAAACLTMILDTMGSSLLNDNRPPRINRDVDTGRQGQRKGQGRAAAEGGVLAHAGAERPRKTGARLPRVRARRDHARDGGRDRRGVRRDRNKKARG